MNRFFVALFATLFSLSAMAVTVVIDGNTYEVSQELADSITAQINETPDPVSGSITLAQFLNLESSYTYGSFPYAERRVYVPTSGQIVSFTYTPGKVRSVTRMRLNGTTVTREYYYSGFAVVRSAGDGAFEVCLSATAGDFSTAIECRTWGIGQSINPDEHGLTPGSIYYLNIRRSGSATSLARNNGYVNFRYFYRAP